MADQRRDAARLDQPRESTRRRPMIPRADPEAFGVLAERFARWMGTAQFLIYMTVFVALWLAWNTFMPPAVQFDPRELNYTLLTLILSLQASYAAPLILLAQNRQDDRDRVALEQDRARDERNLADTEYLTREVASLRIAMRDMATRDFLRSELRDLMEELAQARLEPCPHCGGHPQEPTPPVPTKKAKGKSKHHHDTKRKADRPATRDEMADQARARLAAAPTDPTPEVTPGVTPDVTPGVGPGVGSGAAGGGATSARGFGQRTAPDSAASAGAVSDDR